MNPMSVANLLALGIQLALAGVLAVQRVHGEAKAGVDKKEIAKAEITNAATIALGGLSGTNAQLAQSVAATAIQSIDLAVLISKARGDYQEATAASKTLTAPAS